MKITRIEVSLLYKKLSKLLRKMFTREREKKWAREEIEMVNKYGENLHLH